MSDFHNHRAAEIIRQIPYVTIASVSSDGQPWNTPVYAAFDEGLNFYWFSDKDSQHSKNVRDTKNVFLVIYDSTAPEGTGEGVYLQATVRELSEKNEILESLKTADSRAGKTKARDHADYCGEAVRRGYKATPTKVWTNDCDRDEAGTYIRDIRVEVDIEQLKKGLKG
jgi:general stress protein 26